MAFIYCNAETLILEKATFKECVERKEAKKVGRNVGALGYLECSALTQDGLYELFDFVIKVMLLPGFPPQPRSLTPSLKSFRNNSYNKCSIL